MKEIPILFSTMMAQANMEGRKTKTRRVKCLDIVNEDPDSWFFEEKFTHVGKFERDNHIFRFIDRKGSFIDISCPYGRPGDLLWVRESWQLSGWNFEDGMMTVRYATGETHQCFAPDPGEDSSWLLDKVEQLEDGGYIKPDSDNDERFVFTDKKQPFKPSIYMPKDAARIWLQVSDIRVERLKDITEADAIAEGVEQWPDGNYKAYGKHAGKYMHARDSYFSFWEHINGVESLEANPWVWVISYKILSVTGKPDLQTLKAIV